MTNGRCWRGVATWMAASPISLLTGSLQTSPNPDGAAKQRRRTLVLSPTPLKRPEWCQACTCVSSILRLQRCTHSRVCKR
ncbi:unnamed protein product, partial [Ectocarpus sp. 12 AP-2014]